MRDRDEVKIILNLYREDKISLDSALRLLGYDGPKLQNNLRLKHLKNGKSISKQKS